MICFAWSEFPQYAARCVGALVANLRESVVVIATRPRVPIKGMELVSGCPVVWIDQEDARPLKMVVGEVPRHLFVSGWGTPVFNRYRDQVRDSGGKVIAMSDNNFRFSFKEILKAIRFRMQLRKYYDGYFVAGKSCARLLRFYGVPSSIIRTGMYSADSSIFNDGGVDICARPKKIIFVGQLCRRKNPIRLCEAFCAVEAAEKGWSLDLYGCGPLKDEIPQGKGIKVHDFLQPDELSRIYRSARIFCLPSLEEHWGLVVHEAALSGCLLLLSDAVGSKDDFLTPFNGSSFQAENKGSLTCSLARLMRMSEEEQRQGSRVSISVARKVSLGGFVSGVQSFLRGSEHG